MITPALGAATAALAWLAIIAAWGFGSCRLHRLVGFTECGGDVGAIYVFMFAGAMLACGLVLILAGALKSGIAGIILAGAGAAFAGWAELAFLSDLMNVGRFMASEYGPPPLVDDTTYRARSFVVVVTHSLLSVALCATTYVLARWLRLRAAR